MIANALWTDPSGTGVTLAIIVVGVPLFYLWKRATRS